MAPKSTHQEAQGARRMWNPESSSLQPMVRATSSGKKAKEQISQGESSQRNKSKRLLNILDDDDNDGSAQKKAKARIDQSGSTQRNKRKRLPDILDDDGDNCSGQKKSKNSLASLNLAPELAERRDRLIRDSALRQKGSVIGGAQIGAISQNAEQVHSAESGFGVDLSGYEFTFGQFSFRRDQAMDSPVLTQGKVSNDLYAWKRKWGNNSQFRLIDIR
jgi:hypothetical protein